MFTSFLRQVGGVLILLSALVYILFSPEQYALSQTSGPLVAEVLLTVITVFWFVFTSLFIWSLLNKTPVRSLPIALLSGQLLIIFFRVFMEPGLTLNDVRDAPWALSFLVIVPVVALCDIFLSLWRQVQDKRVSE